MAFDSYTRSDIRLGRGPYLCSDTASDSWRGDETSAELMNTELRDV